MTGVENKTQLDVSITQMAQFLAVILELLESLNAPTPLLSHGGGTSSAQTTQMEPRDAATPILTLISPANASLEKNRDSIVLQMTMQAIQTQANVFTRATMATTSQSADGLKLELTTCATITALKV